MNFKVMFTVFQLEGRHAESNFLKYFHDLEGPTSARGCCKLVCSDECQMLQGKCMRAGDATSTRNGMWEILEDSKCFELILLLSKTSRV